MARVVVPLNFNAFLEKAKLKEKSLNAKMQYDPKFSTSPIFVTDKDYEFSVDPEIIIWLNLILFMAMNMKLLWHILLN